MPYLRGIWLPALSVFFLGWSSAAVQAQVLYGITRSLPANLITIDTSTGAGTLIGPINNSVRRPLGLAFRGNRLYAYERKGTDQLWELDPVTGAVITKFNFAINVSNEGDLAFRSDGMGFVGFNSLYRLDLTVPVATSVGPLAKAMDGLAFNGSDVLYGLVQGGGELYTIDQGTGAMTLVGNPGLSGFNLGGLAFDASGTLFAVLSSVGGPSSLYRINPTTGAATFVGNVGFNEVSGIAIKGTAVPPPPAVYQLYGTTWNGQLIAIDPATGAGTSFGINPPTRAFGLDFLGTSLYVYDQPLGVILQLNPTTAATVAAVNIGLAAAGEGDLSFRSDGIGFLARTSPSQLVQFDLAVPNSAVVGPMTQQFDGLAFDASDVLFGLRERGTELYTIDPATGATTLIGATGVSYANNGTAGLAFDALGVLYAATSDGVGSPSYLYRINPSTGAATLIGNIGFDGVSGIRFGSGAPPPPPPPPLPPPPSLPPGGEGFFRRFAAGEGNFGFGGGMKVGHRQLSRTPALEEPVQVDQDLWKVLNVSHRQGVAEPAAETEYSIFIISAGLALVLAFGFVVTSSRFLAKNG